MSLPGDLSARLASAYRHAADAPGTTKAERDRWLAIADQAAPNPDSTSNPS